YLTMTPRQTPLVALHVTSYAPQMELPPNEQAAEDYQRFRQAFLVRSANRGKRVGNVNIGFWEQPGDDGVVQRSTLLDLLVKPLSNNRFRPGGPKKNIVMFYISAHGVVNDRGEPCLLTSDSSATKAAEWLTVEELLKRLLDHPEYGRQSSVKKIVCLD